jgi:menaquinol-cytochrome c reductase iron-sulfur subunit
MKKEKASHENALTAAPNPAPANGATRRSFLAWAGAGATIFTLAGHAYALLRSLVPNVLYEDSRRFKVGTPDQFGEGARFLQERRVFVFRDRNTFYAISAACTHLGCTVKMERLNRPQKVKLRGREFEEQAEFHCPCHGSKYYGDGTNYAGPAPRPLAYYKVELSPDDGQLIVDLSEEVGQDYRMTV